MSREQACAWCGHQNLIELFALNVCAVCGHKADRTRAACDCPLCDRARPVGPYPMPSFSRKRRKCRAD